MCHGTVQTVCQRSGIPPTTNVASPKSALTEPALTDAAEYCDGYVWSERPGAHLVAEQNGTAGSNGLPLFPKSPAGAK